MTALVWFRNDLRVRWHSPLAAALTTGEPVRAVYLLAQRQWQEHGVAPIRQWYVLHSLLSLGDALAQLGVPLEVVEAPAFADAPAALERLVRRHGICRVYFNKDYPLNEVARDRQVGRMLSKEQVEIHAFDDGMLVPPATLGTGHGKPYTVFTPYRRQWETWLERHPPEVQPSARGRQRVDFDTAPVERALAGLRVDSELTQLWRPGEEAARQRLNEFVSDGLPSYHRQRDFPFVRGTSLLSTALSAGTLAVAECYRAAAARGGVGAQTWINELCWRDFYRQVMANFPHLAQGEAFRRDAAYVQWSRDGAAFQAWCDGRTGYPLVDAAMRQLLRTGWMHNRLRMLTAMFLSKHLFVDWRWGERWFMQHLVDGDFAANNGGWQWSASTGTDAVPWFRIFNPVRQSKRFDPAGSFIRQYVPELAHLDEMLIHEPWKKPAVAPDYPPPIVDLVGVRERVVEAFRCARELAQGSSE